MKREAVRLPVLRIVVIFCRLFRAPPGVPAAIPYQQFLNKIDLPLLLAVVASFNAAALPDFEDNRSDARRCPFIKFGSADGIEHDAESDQSRWFGMNGCKGYQILLEFLALRRL